MAHEVLRENDSLIVRVSGRLDAQSAPSLESEMSTQLHGISDVTFDVAGLDHLSSAGLRVLFATYKLMNKRGGAMRLVHVGENVMGVLAMSGFDKIFKITDAD